MENGSIFFNSSIKKIFVKDLDNLVEYTRNPVPEIILPDYIGYGTDFASEQTVQLDADKFYIIGRCSKLTITLPSEAVSDCKEYWCQIYIGDSSFTLSVPDEVLWQDGETPEFESNSCIQLCFVNNLATFGTYKHVT